MKRQSAPIEGRPPAFAYRAERVGILRRASGNYLLHCDDVPLPRLAVRYGTPLYVYSASAIRERLEALHRAFRRSPHTICYSVKANSSLALLRLLARMDCAFDVVSGGELERVLRVDRKAGRRVVFSGVGKKREELDLALRAGILLFNIESEEELEALANRAARLRRKASIAFRVNPDVPADTHPYIATGLQEHKFGIPWQDVRALYSRAAAVKHLDVAGVSVHIGSQITKVAPFKVAMERVARLVGELREDGHVIRFVDAGGGLGIPYHETLPEFSTYAEHYADAVLGPLHGLKVQLLLEPGRVLVGPAGVMLTSVLYRKTNKGKNFVVVDAAMNDLLRPSLYNAYHEIIPVRRVPDAPVIAADVVGPICESGDYLARGRRLQLQAQDDVLAVLDAGAYGMALASNYNSRPRPAEVLVDAKSVRLIRRRESQADLTRNEIP
jgi:diaminopimelate decarboxylase